MGAAPLAVSVEEAQKTFRIPHQQYHTIKERALHPFRSRSYDEFHALTDVSLGVQRGEFFGVVGRNGSGKSTLLKCIAGIYQLDGGTISVEGRLSPFIELGVGFNPDLAAEDNVVINAVMMGLSRAEARRRFEEVVAFAELEEFVDLKLKNYSSGMTVRLGFAVATQVDADVLLVDEVLAVGDASFQQKCFEVFQRLKDAGKTIVLVTHDMGLVERFCDRAMLIERGRVVSVGDPHDIGVLYNQVNFGTLAPDLPVAATGERPVDIRTCRVEVAGEPVGEVPHGETLDVVFEARFAERVEHPVFGVLLRNEAGQTVVATTTAWSQRETGVFDAGETATVRLQLDAWFGPGRYSITPSVARQGLGADTLDLRENMATVILHSTRDSGGLIDPPHRFDIERAQVRTP
ncbi:MAG TPA: ABC transporter ATP-binding protein [Thermoleophilaceae bacterium]|jgi:ABC-2 type transport system ATP-binding protein|nr:ABC transporter ATP-binding protein [Thermoleophilaceae bacterium]